MKHFSDIELYKLLQSDTAVRDRAFNEIYMRYSSRIYSYCLTIIGNSSQADDAFQETFLLFLKASKKDRNVTNVPAYLLRIARNLCIETNSKQQGKDIIISIDGLDFIDNKSNTLESSELSQMISAALELVTNEQREAFILQTDYELSYQEIADIMNVPVSTIRNWIVRTKSKLRQILSSYLTVI